MSSTVYIAKAYSRIVKPWTKRLLFGILSGTFIFFAAAEAAPPEVPERIYQWVQSSSRMNYFFNKEQIGYEVDQDGKINLNVLIVPAIKTYDTVQIADVVEKRRWRMLSTAEYAQLAGEADYYRIDLAARTVTLTEMDYIDVNFWPIERTKPNKTVEIDKLSEKSRDGIFYRAIIEYAEKHEEEMIARSRGVLSDEDKARREAEKAEAERIAAEREKELEKERIEEEKRLAKERKEEERRLEKERREAEKRRKRELREQRRLKRQQEREERIRQEAAKKAAPASPAEN